MSKYVYRPPQLKRMDIEGPVVLKRKKTWVSRQAKIKDCLFSYKNQASDKKDKVQVDLRTAKIFISPANQERQASMIYIQPDPLKPDAIRIIFDSELIYNQWLKSVRENSKSDAEFQQLQEAQQELIRNSTMQQAENQNKSMRLAQNDQIQVDMKQINASTVVQNQQNGMENNVEAIIRAKTQRINKTEVNHLRKSENMNNFFRSATRVIQMDDVQNFIKDLVQGKFKLKDREWYLCGCNDGINVYADSRNVKLDKNNDSLGREQLSLILSQNNKSIQQSVHASLGKSSVLGTVLNFLIIIIGCLNVQGLRFLAPPLFEAYSSLAYALQGTTAEEDPTFSAQHSFTAILLIILFVL